MSERLKKGDEVFLKGHEKTTMVVIKVDKRGKVITTWLSRNQKQRRGLFPAYALKRKGSHTCCQQNDTNEIQQSELGII